MLMSRICYQARVALDAIREFLSGHVPPEKGVMLQWLMLALGTPAAASFIVQHAALLLAVHREADARTHAVQSHVLHQCFLSTTDRKNAFLVPITQYGAGLTHRSSSVPISPHPSSSTLIGTHQLSLVRSHQSSAVLISTTSRQCNCPC